MGKKWNVFAFVMLLTILSVTSIHALQGRQKDYLNDTQVSLNEAICTALPIHYC